jgi:signal transduction histidine kinase/ligand-binding sensor domain-containing protein/DNA-binding response OmpR family regulator
MAYKVHIVFFSIIPILLFNYSILFSQSKDIRFEHLTEEDGISQATILCILQDSRGFLWLGNENGLNRYDGYEFKVFQNDPEDSTTLSENRVQVIFEDDDGILWIGTYGGGLNKYNFSTEKFTEYRYQPDDPTSLSDNEVLDILKDKFGNLWIGTYGGGLNKLESGYEKSSLLSFICYKADINDQSSLSGNEIHSIYEDRNGTILIGTNNGLSIYQREKDNFINYTHNPANPHSISRGEVYSIYQDKGGNFWIGTFGGGLNKAVWSENRFEPFIFIHYENIPNDPKSISDNRITKIYESDEGYLWIGTFVGGLNIFNKETERFTCYKHILNDPTSLSNNTIHSIYGDNSGIIWIGTYGGGGLNKYEGLKEQFNPYRYYLNKPLDKTIKGVYQIYEDRSGTLWIATYDGLFKYDRVNGLWKNYTHDSSNPNSLSEDKVISICEDNSGNLWIGTIGGGLNKLDREKEKFSHYKHATNNPLSLSHDIILFIYEDKLGTLWIGTYGGGLNKFDAEKGEFISYKHDPNDPNSISDNRARPIYEDRNGNLWIGTWSGGLNKFDREKGEFIHYKNDPNDSTSISDNNIFVIYEDDSNALWIGTNGGLNKFDRTNKVFKRYLLSDGLPSEIVYGILEDNSDNLWLSTVKGLSKFNSNTEEFKNYDVADGLQGNEFTVFAYCKTSSGEFIFGGNNGINVFHPDSLKDNSHIPPVAITDFQLFNESVPVGFYKKSERTILSKSITKTNELELTYEENVFSFEFAALDFHAPEKNKYTYIMEGFEENWNYTDADRRFVTYTNLDPGEYTFRVKASNNHGIWNEEGASLRIIILPPWWATTWAYIVYAIIILNIIYFTWKLQLNRIRLKHDYQMSKFEADKMHEVDELKSRFFANISHEFRTPLTLIFGPANDVLEKSDDPHTKKNVGIIKRNASRLYSLVNQLLDLSKLESGKMKLQASEQDIIPLLKGYVLSFSSLAERKKIKLSFNAAEDNLNVYIDRDKVEKIITNLLSNALKFTPEGGNIDFTVEKLDSYAEIRVADSGMGIAEERLDKIFDRFYQVDGSHTRESEGTGIGLALTKELVELHKGKIEVESEYGKGTTFEVLLPLGEDHLKPEEIAEKSVQEKSAVTEEETELIPELEKGKKKTGFDILLETNDKPLLLIVEDNADVRKYIISYLEEEYRIQEAVDGEDGLNQAINHIPDLIISDVMMPKMDGFELCNKLKTDERTSHIPIIMLTAKATSKDKIEGYETGADDYIMKPFDSNVLKVRIKNLVYQRKKLREHFRKEGLFELEDKAITSVDKKFLQKVIKVINKNLSDTSFGVEILADEISMSRSNLERKLAALADESPAEIIKRIRLNCASKLIIQKSGNISEIALEVGFSNPAYFSKCFREQFGLTPSEYKTNHS